MAKNSVSCNSLLHLLKVGLTIKINSELLKLQKNCFYVGSVSCSRSLVKNYGDNDNGYSVGIVIRVVESYVTFVSSKPAPKIFSFGRLIDSYLTLVARHKNLSPTSFQSLAKKLQKILSIMMTTFIEPLTCIPRYELFSFLVMITLF